MPLPWMTALKLVPWSDVIEHAPQVLSAARKLLERQRESRDTGTPSPTEGQASSPSVESLVQQLADTRLLLEQQAQSLTQLTQTVAELAEQNAQLVSAVEALRVRTRWLVGTALLGALALGVLLLR